MSGSLFVVIPMAIIGGLIGFFSRRKFPRDRWVIAFIAAWVSAGLSVKALEFFNIDLDEPDYASPHEYVQADLLGENGETVATIRGIHYFYPELLKAQLKVYNFYEMESGKCESNLRAITEEQARKALDHLKANGSIPQNPKLASGVSISCVVYLGVDEDCEKRYKSDPQAQRKAPLQRACEIKKQGYGPVIFKFDASPGSAVP